MIVGIVGTRHDIDPWHIERAMAVEIGALVTKVVSGGQIGVDSLAERWAAKHGVEFQSFPVSSERGSFVERAHARNQKIAETADYLIAFPCSHSKGTWDTLARHALLHGEANHVIHRVTCKREGRAVDDPQRQPQRSRKA